MSSECDEDDEDEKVEKDDADEEDKDEEEPSSDIPSDIATANWMKWDVLQAKFKAIWCSRTVFQRRNDIVQEAMEWWEGLPVCTALLADNK
jgi:hypothetical protein